MYNPHAFGRRYKSPRMQKQEVGFPFSDSNKPCIIHPFSTLKKGVPQSEATVIHEDHLACIGMSVKRVRRKYSRHIDFRRHYMREVCLSGSVKLVPLRTHHMVPDALTTSLPAGTWSSTSSQCHYEPYTRALRAISGG
jgi:hypothetical protein